MAGAPKGNTNRLRTGLRSRKLRYNLKLGLYPPQFTRAIRNVHAYRRTLEAEVSAVYETITIDQAHLIDEVVAAEAHCAIVRWVLRHRFDDLQPSEIVAVSREIHRAKRDRNKALAELKLDQGPDDDGWPTIDAPAALEHDANGNGTPEPPATPEAADEPAEPLDVQTPLEEPRPEPTP